LAAARFADRHQVIAELWHAGEVNTDVVAAIEACGA
jgi:hypothetical protein